jgi:hypothetical protein
VPSSLAEFADWASPAVEGGEFADLREWGQPTLDPSLDREEFLREYAKQSPDQLPENANYYLRQKFRIEQQTPQEKADAMRQFSRYSRIYKAAKSVAFDGGGRPDIMAATLAKHAIPKRDHDLFQQAVAEMTQQKVADQGPTNAAARFGGAVKRGFANLGQSLMPDQLSLEERNVGRRMAAGREQFDPLAREDDATLMRWAIQAAEMAPTTAFAGAAGSLTGGLGAAISGTVGGAVGGIAGAGAAMVPAEIEESYALLRQAGIPEETAKRYAAVTGTVSGAVEGILPNPAKGLFAGSLKGILGRAVTNYGVELSEEALQSAIKQAGVATATRLDETAPDSNLGDAVRTVIDDTLSAAGPLALMMGTAATPGVVRKAISTPAELTQQNPQAAATIAAKEQPSRKDFEEAGLPKMAAIKRKEFAAELRAAIQNPQTFPFEQPLEPTQNGTNLPTSGNLSPQPLTEPQPKEPDNALRQTPQVDEVVQQQVEPAAPVEPATQENQQVEPPLLVPPEALPQPEAAREAPPPPTEPLQAASIWRETSGSDANFFLPGQQGSGYTFGPPELFFSDNPDLAIGQGGNQGVLLEFDPHGIQLREHAKPGTAIPGVGKEFVAAARPEELQANLRSVTVKPSADAVTKKRFKLLLKEWSAAKNPDGSVTYRREPLPAAPVEPERTVIDFTKPRRRGKMAEGTTPKALLDKAVIDHIGEDPENQSIFRQMIDEIYDRNAEFEGPRIAAIKHAREITGLDAGKIARWERAGKDHSTWPRFDALARTVAYEVEDLALDPKDPRLEEKVWNLIKEGASRLPAKHSTEVLADAFEMFRVNFPDRVPYEEPSSEGVERGIGQGAATAPFEGAAEVEAGGGPGQPAGSDRERAGQEERFELQQEAAAGVKKPDFAPDEKKSQRKLISGLDALPGQQDLFEGIDREEDEPPSRGPKLGISPPGALPLNQMARDVRQGKSAATSFVRRFFTTKGHLPAEVHEAKLAKDAWINAQLKQVTFTLNDFDKAAKQAYGGRTQISDQERAALDSVLKGGDPMQIPEAMRDPVLRMRNEIDALSARMILSGAVEGPLELTIEENLGTYVTRSYRVFDDPKWAERVPPDVRNRAKALLRSEYPEWNDNQLEQLLNALLYQDKAAETPIAVLRRSKLGSKDLSILKHRKDIAPEIRALWGEYDDPRVNYSRSVTKMAHLVGNHQFLADVKAKGLGKFFFREGDADINPEAKAKIAADASQAMYPLNGLVTFPEVKAAFEREYNKQALPTWLRWWMRINGLAKYSKTVGSVITHARNFVSNIPIVVGQGHWRLNKLGTAYRGARPGVETSLPTTPNDWRAFHRKLTELGVIDESVHVGELQGVLNDAFDMTPDQFSDHTIRRAIRRGGKAAADIYQTGDSYWKVYAWANERARYAKAKPELSDEALDKLAANIVRDTLPTYSMIPEGVRNLRRFPLVGPFVSFASERFRNFAKTMQLIQSEMKDPATRGIAAERIAGHLAKFGLYAGAAVTARFLVGVSGDDEEDMREFLAPWNKNSTLIWMDRNSFVDLSYTDPDAALAKPFMAFLRGDNWTDSFAEAVGEVAAPFVGEELVTARLLDIARNKTESGRPVYSPQDAIEDQAVSIAAHIWEAIEPGTITSAKRVKKGVTGEVERGGRSYDPTAEAVGAMTGFRVQEIDVPQSLGFRASRYVDQLHEANRLLTRVAMNRGTVTRAQLEEAYGKSERARRKLFDETHQAALAATRLGMSQREVFATFNSAGLSERDARAVLVGVYQPYVPSTQTLTQIAKMPGGMGRVQAIREAAAEQRELVSRLQAFQ